MRENTTVYSSDGRKPLTHAGFPPKAYPIASEFISYMLAFRVVIRAVIWFAVLLSFFTVGEEEDFRWCNELLKRPSTGKPFMGGEFICYVRVYCMG